jgi:hypothetical protein
MGETAIRYHEWVVGVTRSQYAGWGGGGRLVSKDSEKHWMMYRQLKPAKNIVVHHKGSS